MPRKRLHWLTDIGGPTEPGDYMVPAIDGETVRVESRDTHLAAAHRGRLWFTALRTRQGTARPVWVLEQAEPEPGN
ncbi:MAG: hypothetical protein AB7F67_04385 [Rhodospirillaceae bacterium]